MWSLILVFGVAAVIFVISGILLIKKAGFAGVLFALAFGLAYVAVTAPIAGMICGNNTVC